MPKMSNEAIKDFDALLERTHTKDMYLSFESEALKKNHIQTVIFSEVLGYKEPYCRVFDEIHGMIIRLSTAVLFSGIGMPSTVFLAIIWDIGKNEIKREAYRELDEAFEVIKRAEKGLYPTPDKIIEDFKDLLDDNNLSGYKAILTHITNHEKAPFRFTVTKGECIVIDNAFGLGDSEIKEIKEYEKFTTNLLTKKRIELKKVTRDRVDPMSYYMSYRLEFIDLITDRTRYKSLSTLAYSDDTSFTPVNIVSLIESQLDMSDVAMQLRKGKKVG